MNTADILILLALAVCLIMASVHIIKERRKGKGCCGDCSSCSDCRRL